MKKEKIIATAAILGTLLSLSGCKNNKNETLELNNDSEPIAIVAEDTERIEDTTQVFEPFTHYIEYYSYFDESQKFTNFETYNQFGHTSGYIDSNLPVIEGYSVYDVEPITEKYGYGSRTVGFVYFLVNTDTVEVTGKYNYNDNTYHFSEPGTLYDVYGLELDK